MSDHPTGDSVIEYADPLKENLSCGGEQQWNR